MPRCAPRSARGGPAPPCWCWKARRNSIAAATPATPATCAAPMTPRPTSSPGPIPRRNSGKICCASPAARPTRNWRAIMIRESKDILDWIVEQGVRWQPSLGGTLSLGRTNSFFLGGGRAMLNALYLTAEQLGVDILYDAEVRRSRHRRRHVPVGDAEAADRRRIERPRLDAGRRRRRLRGQHRMAEGILGRGRRQFPDPRHALQSRLDPEDAARQGRAGGRRSHAMPRGRDRRPRAEIRRRHHHAARFAWCSASSSTSTPQRFYDEGEDIWPKRYAIWGRLVAAQPDQIAYIIFDASVAQRASCRRCFRRSRPTRSPSSPASSSSIRRRWKRPSPTSTPRCGPAPSITPSSTIAAPRG